MRAANFSQQPIAGALKGRWGRSNHGCSELHDQRFSPEAHGPPVDVGRWRPEQSVLRFAGVLRASCCRPGASRPGDLDPAALALINEVIGPVEIFVPSLDLGPSSG